MSNTIYEEVKTAFEEIDYKKIYRKTVLITGATGLIGSYFCETIHYLNEVKNAGIHLYMLSHSGLPTHLSEFDKYDWVTLLKGDLSDREWRRNLPSADYIIHAAGYGQPGKFMLDPLKVIEINTSATSDLLAKTNPGGSFLFISTSELYSGLDDRPCREADIGSTTPLHPRACYIEGKRCGEAICYSYRNNGVDAKCARLALAYGPGTRIDDKRVLNEFIRKAVINKKLEMQDSGMALRTYCYVTDAVELMWNILLFGREPVYNVGGHSVLLIRELAKMIAEQLNAEVVIPEIDNEFEGAPKTVTLDLSKAETEFDKHEYVSMEEGLNRTINWQIKNLYSENE